MKNPCEIIARHILPAFRSLIAKGLIEEYDFTQVAAAEKLGTTQAAISYYLSSKRGEKYITLLENNTHVKTKLNEIIEGLVTNSFSSEKATGTLCDLCTYLRDNDQLNLIQG
jgi:predicted transcriptional regulator